MRVLKVISIYSDSAYSVTIYISLGIVFVYDISQRKSFKDIEEVWIPEVEQYCKHNLERIQTVLIGNKLDLEKQVNLSRRHY